MYQITSLGTWLGGCNNEVAALSNDHYIEVPLYITRTLNERALLIKELMEL